MTSDDKCNKINQKTLNRLLERIYNEEHENFITQKYKTNEMHKRIRTIIEVEVNKDED